MLNWFELDVKTLESFSLMVLMLGDLVNCNPINKTLI